MVEEMLHDDNIVTTLVTDLTAQLTAIFPQMSKDVLKNHCETIVKDLGPEERTVTNAITLCINSVLDNPTAGKTDTQGEQAESYVVQDSDSDDSVGSNTPLNLQSPSKRFAANVDLALADVAGFGSQGQAFHLNRQSAFTSVPGFEQQQDNQAPPLPTFGCSVISPANQNFANTGNIPNNYNSNAMQHFPSYGADTGGPNILIHHHPLNPHNNPFTNAAASASHTNPPYMNDMVDNMYPNTVSHTAMYPPSLPMTVQAPAARVTTISDIGAAAPDIIGTSSFAYEVDSIIPTLNTVGNDQLCHADLAAPVATCGPSSMIDLTAHGPLADRSNDILNTAKPEKTQDEKIAEMVAQVENLIPDACTDFVKTKLQAAFIGNQNDDPVTVVINQLLEHSYPKKPKAPSKTKIASVPKNINYLEDVSVMDGFPSVEYRLECSAIIKHSFLKIKAVTLERILALNNQRFAPTFCSIYNALKMNDVELGIESVSIEGLTCGKENFCIKRINIKKAPLLTKVVTCPPYKSEGKSPKASIAIEFLKCGRHKHSSRISAISHELMEEIKFTYSHIETESDRTLTETPTESEACESGESIECGCCFGMYAFYTMVQCYEGHLFCKQCLQAYAREAVFGQGKLKMQCMSDGCEEIFPPTELQRTLSKDVFEKYEERNKEENINLADLEDFVKCPACDYGAVLDQSCKVFSCDKCGKESCRYCKEDWGEHFGIPCDELEKKDETKSRLAFEERMTGAKIRKCVKCKAGFTKEDGCNKMTCRCGATMCYICRKPDIDYNHFCQHVREPGKNCHKCKNCSLWTNPEQDDDQAVAEIKKEAEKTRADGGMKRNISVGVPDALPKKRQKVEFF